MSWYYADNGRQAGPVDDASLDALISQGAVRPDTLVWREGMTNWQALNTVRPVAPPAPAPLPVVAPPPPAAAAPVPVYSPEPQPSFQQPQYQQPAFQQPSFQQPQQPLFQAPSPAGGAPGVTCANCGQLFAQTDVVFIGSSYVCAGCKPIFLQRMREGSAGGAVGARRYASFGIRVSAFVIDFVLFYVSLYLLSFATTLLGLPVILAASSRGEAAGIAAYLAFLIAAFVLCLVPVAGFAYMLSVRGALPGQLLLGLKVIRSDGSGLSLWRALARLLAYFLSFMFLGIGFIIAAFDDEGRALHDYLCDTRVVYR